MTDRGEYRSIRTVIVDGPDFKRLHPNTKLVWIYIKLQLGPLGLGVFNSAKHVLSEQTGLKPRQVDDALKELDTEPNWFRREDNIFWIVGGLKNEPAFKVANSNHRTSVRQLVGALPRLAIIADFKRAHPEWFADAIREPEQPLSNGIGEAITDTIPDTIGDAIPDATGINGRGKTKTKTEDKDKDGEGRQNDQASPSVSLPREATQFLAMFYEPAFNEKQRERYLDVKRQLYDVLDPKHPGPKIRGGLRVKARSVEHLVDELRAVMKDPPPDRDLAIVWLLKRLTNPPKGETYTEKLKREEVADRELEEQYHAAAKRAGIEWAKEHPDEFEPIQKQVEASYRDRSGLVVNIAKESELTQRCAKAAGFPDFDAWKAKRLLKPQPLAASHGATA